MIRKANLNDVDGIMDIVNQIVVEMKESNNTQWMRIIQKLKILSKI